jgi:hypothetical protein
VKRYLVGNRRAYLFVMLQAIFYAIFLTLDIIGNHNTISSVFKFGIIILCFCFALTNGKGDNKSILFCMKTALFFTVLSDLFLLILDYYICGLVTFIIVQQLYSIRIMLSDSQKADKAVMRFLLQIVLAAVVCLLLWLGDVPMEALLVISVFYFVCIVTNVFFAVRVALRKTVDKRNVIFAIGMVLFLLCDINVGVFNMAGFIALPDSVYRSLYTLSSILMWTFYAPSQVIITLSSSLNMAKSTK